jgi:hypothetical protein
MNLRQQITTFLTERGMAIAKQIAVALGHADHPGVVINELNAMRGEGLIDVQVKHKNNHYFLTKKAGADGKVAELVGELAEANKRIEILNKEANERELELVNLRTAMAGVKAAMDGLTKTKAVRPTPRLVA